MGEYRYSCPRRKSSFTHSDPPIAFLSTDAHRLPLPNEQLRVNTVFKQNLNFKASLQRLYMKKGVKGRLKNKIYLTHSSHATRFTRPYSPHGHPYTWVPMVTHTLQIICFHIENLDIDHRYIIRSLILNSK